MAGKARNLKRFQILLSPEEFDLLKRESSKKDISSGEFLRMCLLNEVQNKSNYDRILSIKSLAELHE